MDERDIEHDENLQLIASDKVEGTAVFDRKGERLGAVHTLMIAKHSGQVEYAVLTFGGVLGMGAEFHPLPWESLTYDLMLRGYVVDIDKEMLQRGPSFAADEEPAFDRAYGEQVYGYYGLSYPII